MSLYESRRSRHKASGDWGGHAPQLKALKMLFLGIPNAPTLQKATPQHNLSPGTWVRPKEVRESYRQKAKETPSLHLPKHLIEPHLIGALRKMTSLHLWKG